jgi:hypothetical protein
VDVLGTIEGLLDEATVKEVVLKKKAWQQLLDDLGLAERNPPFVSVLGIRLRCEGSEGVFLAVRPSPRDS